MATQTSNLGLTKPAYSETADIADINNNMDKVDVAVNGVQNGLAILANGNVHSAVTSGQYVYVRNHGTLAEGLYTAATNISTNATLSTSNLTAVPNNGALNTLRDDVTSLNSKLSSYVVVETVSFDDAEVTANGNLAYTKSISKTGYTAIGIVRITVSTGTLLPFEWSFNSNATSATVRVWNRSSNAVTGHPNAYILWVKS